MGFLKVAFFQKVRFGFQTSKSPKKIFQKTILNLKFEIPAHNSIMLWARILNFKSRIVFWILFLEIWRFEKRIALSEKKPPLVCVVHPKQSSLFVEYNTSEGSGSYQIDVNNNESE